MSIREDDDLNDEIVNEEEDLQNEDIETEEIESSDPSMEEEPETDQDEDEDDRIVTIGDSEPEEESEEKAETPGWVKKVRKINREQEKEIRKLKRELEAKSAVEKPKPIELGKEPELADFDYDTEKFKHGYAEWMERKRKVEQQQAEAAKIVEEVQQKRQQKVERYVTLKQEHNFKDYNDAEETVETTLDQNQQAVIVQAADDSALVVYALGKNPKKLEELSKLKDPIQFAKELGKLEAQLKVTNRKAPRPEKKITGANSGGISGSSDKVLERLRQEAERTGNYTKVREYKKKLRER